jgi:hypothetical protein
VTVVVVGGSVVVTVVVVGDVTVFVSVVVVGEVRVVVTVVVVGEVTVLVKVVVDAAHVGVVCGGLMKVPLKLGFWLPYSATFP